jgi:hypothetical protein
VADLVQSNAFTGDKTLFLVRGTLTVSLHPLCARIPIWCIGYMERSCRVCHICMRAHRECIYRYGV